MIERERRGETEGRSDKEGGQTEGRSDREGGETRGEVIERERGERQRGEVI